MKHAKLFSVSVALALALYGAVGFYFLPLANFEGGLTRMGKLPETMFGWTREQPAIPPELLVQSSWQDADVFVIGDSFSMEHLWQTALTRRGLKVHTETWENIRGICEDFTPWLRAQGFRGRYVVFEVIERNFEDLFKGSLGCQKMFTHSTSLSLIPPPPTRIDRQQAHYSGRLSVGIDTYLQAAHYLELSKQPGFAALDLGNDTKLVRVENGCRLFSHPQCSDALFYSKDRTTDFGPDILLKMEAVQSKLQDNLTMVWAIVPDKSTAYLNTNKTFWRVSSQRFHAPDLLGVFRGAIENNAVDLYRGNDTHLSTSGYLLMGEAIYQTMLGKHQLSSLGGAR